MRSHLKVLLITGSLVTASLGAAAAAAATAPPVMDTSIFACSTGVCEVGPGNVGMPFAAVLNVKIGTAIPPAGEAEFGYEFTMKIISGSLPPGLQLSQQPSSAWTITGTPAKAGTYPFTVQMTPTPDAGGGPSGTQQLTITIGTGSSDRLVVTGAGFNGHLFRLDVNGYDVNISALYSVSVTSTGKVIIPAQTNSASQDGLLTLTEHPDDPCGQKSCNLTVTDSLGSSVTVTLPPPTY